MVEAEFDKIAEIYDSTRDPATDLEVEAMVRALAGCKSVLDVGIGTGRFAKPLTERGFQVVGIDISRNMMLRARQKGIEDVVLGDVYNLPFRDGAFDASVAVHVLHIVKDWRSMMKEVGRVTTKGVFSLLRARGWERWRRRGADDPNGVRAMYVRLRQEAGYPVQNQGRAPGRMWQNEGEVRSEVPPSRSRGLLTRPPRRHGKRC